MKKTFLLLLMSLILSFPVLAATNDNVDPSALMCFPFFMIFPLLYLCIWLVMFLAIVAGVILWIVMLIDVIQREDKDFPPGQKDPKVLWLLIILLTNQLGALIYYFMVYRKQKQSN